MYEGTLFLGVYESSVFTGQAKGVLFEDDGDGYEFSKGGYRFTHYAAELHSSIVTVRVSTTEGSWERPKRRLLAKILLGGGAMVCLDNIKESHRPDLEC